MTYRGEVTLPDGRIVYAVAHAFVDRSTNTLDVDEIEIEWKDGDPLTDDEYNEYLGENNYGIAMYLHEYVTDKLCEQAPDLDDEL